MLRKRFGAALLAVLLAASMLGGCSRKQQETVEYGDTLSVYASFYPLFALTEMIVHDVPNLELHCLVQPQDGCLRDYQLSDWDMALLAGSADIVIVGGEGLESFENTLYALGENGAAVVSAMYGMDLANTAAQNASADAESHWAGPNPHAYMTADGAAEICRRIANSMSVLDAEHKDIYETNLQNAEQRLKDMHDEYSALLAPAQGESVVVMNEALVYAAQEYGLSVERCYMRESGEDLSGSDLDACIEELNSCDARWVLIEKQAPQNLCRRLEKAGFELIKMDVMSTRRADEGFEGYFEAQQENARALSKAVISSNTPL